MRDVDAQGGAYATGVLVLMLSAAVAAALALWRENRPLSSLYCWLVSAVFLYTLVANVFERPDGIIIASIFITAVIGFSAASRYRRATELRVANLTIVDDASARTWESILDKKVNLVPIRGLDAAARRTQGGGDPAVLFRSGPIGFYPRTTAG